MYRFENYWRLVLHLGVKTSRNPTIDKVATLHMITLSSNSITPFVVQKAQANNVRLFHSTLEYMEYEMLGDKMIAVKIKNQAQELTSYPGVNFDVTGALQMFGLVGSARDIRWDKIKNNQSCQRWNRILMF